MSNTQIETTSYQNLLDTVAGKGHIITIGGYSGQGYTDNALVVEHLFNAIKDNPSVDREKGVVLVSGATDDGGICSLTYGKELQAKLDTIGLTKDKVIKVGIVSEAGKEWGCHPGCQVVHYVKDPEKSWKVLDEDGRSLMVKINEAGRGEMLYVRGGGVSASEIEDATKNNIGVTLVQDGRLAPSPAVMEKKATKALEKAVAGGDAVKIEAARGSLGVAVARASQIKTQCSKSLYDGKEDMTLALTPKVPALYG